MLKKVLPVALLLVILAGCASGTPETPPSPSAAVSPSPPVSSGVSAAASPSPSPSAAAAPIPEQLDAIFENDATFHGSVLIAQDGKVLLDKGYGMADNEKKIANAPGTEFPIGSNTKQFTAMAIMQLYEKGLLDINDKLSKYFPDFPRGGDITLTQLLTHTSGLVDYMNETAIEFNDLPLDKITEENIIKMIENKPLNFEPGEKFSYSNTGYLMLGCIVEKVSGLSYEAYMKKNIFEPLGMKNTGLVYADGRETFSVVGYSNNTAISNSEIKANDIVFIAEKVYKGAFGAGCLYSTTQDMYLWAQALNTEKLLSKKYMDMIFTPYVSAIEKMDYGYGWFLKSDAKLGDAWWHGGKAPGFTSEIYRYVDKGITMIILTNENNYYLSGLETKVMQALSE